jgi:hypothetical protein
MIRPRSKPLGLATVSSRSKWYITGLPRGCAGTGMGVDRMNRRLAFTEAMSGADCDMLRERESPCRRSPT